MRDLDRDTSNVNADPGPADAGTSAKDFNFHDALLGLLPRLKVWAFALTRNRADADDLVQAAVVNALSAQASFSPGTNFVAWMYRILRNRFLSDRRRARDTVDLDDAPAESVARLGNQEDHLALQELHRNLARLPVDQRTALIMVSVQGMSYDQVAEATGCAVGTAKCRVFRARRQLEAWLIGADERPSKTARIETRVQAGVRGPSSGKMKPVAADQAALSRGM